MMTLPFLIIGPDVHVGKANIIYLTLIKIFEKVLKVPLNLKIFIGYDPNLFPQPSLLLLRPITLNLELRRKGDQPRTSSHLLLI
jgi:hypothetical protein